METNVNYTIVGAFVVVLLAAMLTAILWLSSGFDFKTYTTYELYMQDSVSGLNVDSPVEYNGVNVGDVASITIDPTNPHLVIVLIEINSNTPVTRGTVATLTTRGITGIAFIALKDKSVDMHPLTKLPGHKYPIIQTAPSLFTRLDTALSRLSDNIQKVTVSIQELLNQQNLDAIQVTLSNLKSVTTRLADNGKQLDDIILNTRKATARLTPLLVQSEGAMRNFQNMTLPSMQHLMTNLDDVSRNLVSITNEMKQNPSVLIRGTMPLPPGPGEVKP